MPRVSVIIPTYNRRPLVVEAAASVLSQTLADLELLIVDDGSTDETRDAIGTITDPRLHYVYKPNGGVSSARNAGLAMAQNQFVCFLDSDDLWPANFLSTMLAAMDAQPDADISYCPRRLHYADGSTERRAYWDDRPSGCIANLLFTESFMQVSSMCFRRKILDGFAFDEKLLNAEDVDAWVRLSMRARFLFVPSVEITFRIGHGVSQRTRFSYQNCNELLALQRYYLQLGGKSHISALTARRRFSKLYQQAAKYYWKKGCRAAAIGLYKRAIWHEPWNLHLYGRLLKSLRLSRKNDPEPKWQMPAPLGDIAG